MKWVQWNERCTVPVIPNVDAIPVQKPLWEFQNEKTNIILFNTQRDQFKLNYNNNEIFIH